ncbi:unnamed protein product, partial [Rotaria sp. Silwood2]
SNIIPNMYLIVKCLFQLTYFSLHEFNCKSIIPKHVNDLSYNKVL